MTNGGAFGEGASPFTDAVFMWEDGGVKLKRVSFRSSLSLSLKVWFSKLYIQKIGMEVPYEHFVFVILCLLS